MTRGRGWLALAALGATAFSPVVTTMDQGAPAQALGEIAAPIDTWPVTHGIDCLHDAHNPVDADGERDSSLEPVPGTPEWDLRDSERVDCAQQRDHDRRYHPALSTFSSIRYGEDPYRVPQRFDQRRFRYDLEPLGTGAPMSPGYEEAPSIEMYRPCDNDTCSNMAEGLERFEAPYPVVIIHHGAIATKEQHRFNAQVFAENGYLAITVSGTHPVPNAPNMQRNQNAGYIMDWLASDESGEIGAEADLDRIVVAGHSMGGTAAMSYQGDARVDAIVAWDTGADIDPELVSQPVMHQSTDGAFSRPQDGPHPDYPADEADRFRARDDYGWMVEDNGLDMMHVNFLATNHIDWNGSGVGSLAGNRMAELAINYYSLAWMDRYARGLVVRDDNDEVITSHGRTVIEEVAFRQGVADDAFARLTSMTFDDSADRHNISMGWWDPVQAATSGDPVFGGNVPYRIEGQWITERLAYEYPSTCHVTRPRYTASTDLVAETADSGREGDMYYTGCQVTG